jgi:spermidine synthase
MTFNSRSFIFLISIYVAFFASGASSLIAEVTWNRMLIVVVGNSMSATAMILVVFMGGLGLGSYVGGKIFGKRRVSLVPYLLLEIAIGIWGKDLWQTPCFPRALSLVGDCHRHLCPPLAVAVRGGVPPLHVIGGKR